MVGHDDGFLSSRRLYSFGEVIPIHEVVEEKSVANFVEKWKSERAIFVSELMVR